MKINLLYILPIIIIISSGCDFYNSRECDAFYYDYNKWQTINENDTLKFISNNNEDITFILSEINLSDPYTEGYLGGSGGDNNPETVTCKMRARFIYNSPELGVDLKLEFGQIELFEQPIDEQIITYSVAFKEEMESEFVLAHAVRIEPGFSLLNINHTTFDSLTINNQIYYDLIQSVIDTTSAQVSNISYWKLIASRGKGIIYLADRNGKEYFFKE